MYFLLVPASQCFRTSRFELCDIQLHCKDFQYVLTCLPHKYKAYKYHILTRRRVGRYARLRSRISRLTLAGSFLFPFDFLFISFRFSFGSFLAPFWLLFGSLLVPFRGFLCFLVGLGGFLVGPFLALAVSLLSLC